MKLSEIQSGLARYGYKIDFKHFDPDFQITGVTDRTAECKKGFIFVCIKGRSFDGHNAAARMTDEHNVYMVIVDHDIGLKNQVIVDNTREFYGVLCALWFGSPEKKMTFAAVTGTNGKTTTASLIAQILRIGGQTVGLIGTTGVFVMDEKNTTELDAPNNTTPPVYDLYRILSEMEKKLVTSVVMEVSSFALDQGRIGPIRFDVSVYTNLSQDHLDYHETMESYYQSKRRLFTHNTKTAIINVDDQYGLRLYTELVQEKPNDVMVYNYGTAKNCQILIESAKYTTDSTKFRMEAGGTFFLVSTKLVGDYNVYNAAAAIAAANTLGMGIQSVVRAVAAAEGVKGRCEIIPCNRGFSIICDYAHTPDALTKVCSALKKTCTGRLIVVFGCGGDRDRDKRPKMGKAVQALADVCIVTSDNPRNEDPESIIDQITDGMDTKKPLVRIVDRKAAINHAISIAKKDDLILLAGKGHETYQILANDLTIPFDERKIVADMLARYKAPLPTDGTEGKIRLSEIADAVNGTTRDVNDFTREFSFSDIYTDTREPKLGGIYVALRGENFDGYDFIPAAHNAGAAVMITERVSMGYPCIIVKNTRQALLDIAAVYRKRFSPVMIGITGSVGKTSTKEMVALALSADKSVFKTQGNRNNEIGVPTGLFSLNSSHTAAVVEMGMNHAGEISRISRSVKPDICVITNVGLNHLEFFDTQDDILSAKLEILDGAPRNAPLLMNGNDKYSMVAKKNLANKQRKVLTYGYGGDFDYNAVDITESPGRTTFRVMKKDKYISDVELFVSGIHNVQNALAAVAVADIAGCDTATAGLMLGCFQPLALRQHIEKRGHYTLIVDCYNASPTSMESSLKTLAAMPVTPGARRVAVLGDMLELGTHAEELHEQVGEMVVANGIDLLVCYGDNAKYIARRADELGMHSGYSADINTVKNFLTFKLKQGDVILFKASRGMHMEDLIEDFFK